MPGKERRIEPHALGVDFYDVCHGLSGQPIPHLSALSDGPEYRARRNARGRDPRPQGGHRARCRAFHDRYRLPCTLLVSLAVTDGHLEAQVSFFEVLDVERHEFGTSESAGEADQQQGAITQPLKTVVSRAGHRHDPIRGCRRFLLRCGPKAAANTAHKPGERVPPFGAARSYANDETWQAEVLELIRS